MFGRFTALKGKTKRDHLDYTVSPRLIFALRERLEEEGLGDSAQAENLDRAILMNREYIMEEMKQLFLQMDRTQISRTTDPRFWWWRIDDERVVAEVSERIGC